MWRGDSKVFRDRKLPGVTRAERPGATPRRPAAEAGSPGVQEPVVEGCWAGAAEAAVPPGRRERKPWPGAPCRIREGTRLPGGTAARGPPRPRRCLQLPWPRWARSRSPRSRPCAPRGGRRAGHPAGPSSASSCPPSRASCGAGRSSPSPPPPRRGAAPTAGAAASSTSSGASCPPAPGLPPTGGARGRLKGRRRPGTAPRARPSARCAGPALPPAQPTGRSLATRARPRLPARPPVPCTSTWSARSLPGQGFEGRRRRRGRRKPREGGRGRGKRSEVRAGAGRAWALAGKEGGVGGALGKE